MKGFSKDNLFMMKRFYLFYQSSEIVEQPFQQLESRDNKFIEQVAQQIVPQPVEQTQITVHKFACVPWGFTF